MEEKTNYEYLKSTLSYKMENDEIYFENDDLSEIAAAAMRDITHKQNVGYYVSRIDFNPREKAFHEQWLKENEPNRGVNHGQGTLQDLLIESGGNPFSLFNAKRYITEVGKRDREIVATVIQWLGSNCGMSFLGQALDKCGYKIVKKETTE